MKEHPILFSGPMVRAILEGRKTQTRRVVKLPDYFSEPEWAENGYAGLSVEWSDKVADAEPDDVTDDTPCLPAGWFVHSEEPEDGWAPILCPYGQPGDRLWVRESWCPGVPGVTTLAGKTYGVRPFPKSWTIPKQRPEGVVVKYAASWEDDDPPPMRPSIHMPRWASRITLEVTEVRVQRLQDIQEADALAEGVTVEVRELGALEPFKRLWDSINGKRPGADWQSNPWVWAVSFKRLK